MLMHSHRRHRQPLADSCMSRQQIYHCATYLTLFAGSLLCSPVVTNAFSLVQNAAASSSSSQQQSPSSSSDAPSQGRSRTESRSGKSSSLALSLHHNTPFSAVASSSKLTNDSLNRHHRRHSQWNRQQIQTSLSSSTSSHTDDFTSRMDSMADQTRIETVYRAQLNNNHESHEVSLMDSHLNQRSDGPCPSFEVPSTMIDEDKQLLERRTFLHGMLSRTSAVTAVVVGTTTIPTTVGPLPWSPDPAYAYETFFPLELQMTPIGEEENSSNSLAKLKEERLSYKKAKVKATQMELLNDPLGISSSSSSIHDFEIAISGALTWGFALWLASGSRSNPIVTPLANVLYDRTSMKEIVSEDNGQNNNNIPKNQSKNNGNERINENQWLIDRNDGYFGELPISFIAILSVGFVLLGVILDRTVYFLADGDADVSLQLGGVSVIGGAVWEIGRLATKEKAPTREEYERDVQLYLEFQEFAQKRIIIGGIGTTASQKMGGSAKSSSCSCHRSDVISAFRRYNPKYRTADNEEFPLSDIEIERILRKWNREFGSGSEMSSAGFFTGICVDGVADAFAPR